jgi:hypothetical protein
MNDLQRTSEWYAARLGKLGGSTIADATARTKNGWGSSRANLMATLLTERITGVPAPHYVTPAMQWGIDKEPDAITEYEIARNVDVTLVGFLEHPRIPMSGVSSDGLVGIDGSVSVKCPNTATHIETLLGAEIDGGYIKQMQWEMGVTGREWCDWVSYDPRVFNPADTRTQKLVMVVRRVRRDQAMIDKLEAEAAEFLRELDDKHTALLAQFETQQAAE